MSDRNRHFFEKKRTYAFISEIGVPADWTIYVGLGGTMDRTNIGWENLVARLMCRFDMTLVQAERYVSDIGPQRAATALETMYLGVADSLDKSVAALAGDIRSILYGPRRFMAGRLLRAVSDFAVANAEKGKNIAFVTPNYDSYLWQDIAAAAEIRKIPLEQLTVITKSKRQLPKDWNQARKILCVHIHGYIPEEEKHVGQPILGEPSYHLSSSWTTNVLRKMFQDRNVLIVGSSVTDGPLVSALMDTQPTITGAKLEEQGQIRRYVIQPRQSHEFRIRTDPIDLRLSLRMNEQRLSALSAQSIQPDFYGQTSQLFSEAANCVKLEAAGKIVNQVETLRYDNRLDRWWRDWSKMTMSPEGSALQHEHHLSLKNLMAEIRAFLAIPQAEVTKIELWSRWEPNRDRQLCLWASSVGSWPDTFSMRKDDIDIGSRYKSVQIFCAGAPLFLHEPEDVYERWKAYLGLPIWLEDYDDHSSTSYGVLPVGVISIASMRPAQPLDHSQRNGSIGEHKLRELSPAMVRMVNRGKNLLKPDSPLNGRLLSQALQRAPNSF